MATSRRKSIIIMILSALAVLLCTALFSVTFAKWGGGGATSVTMEASTGLFYVNYPSTTQTSTALDSNAYYVAVPTVDANGKTLYTDYYKMMTTKDPYGNAQFEVSVKLRKDDKVNITKGSTVQTISTSTTGEYKKFTFSGNTGTAPEDGFFAFYYSGSGATVYVNHRPIADYDGAAPMTLDFGNNQKIKLHIKKPTTTTYSTLYMYCYWEKNGSKTEFTNARPGNVMTASFTSLEFKKGNDWYHLYDNQNNEYFNIIFNFGNSKPQSDIINLNKNYLDNTEYEYYVELSYYNSKITCGIQRTIAPITATLDRSDDMVVRKVNTSTGKTETTYKNYVCVSREGGTGTSLAYVNFLVEARGSTTVADLEKVTVSGFKVTRAATNPQGVPTTGKTEEFVYNVPTTLASINGEEKTSDGRKYVVGGTYIMLFFGADDDQYYALDVEIKTVIDSADASLSNVDFTLKAVAANADWRNQYKPGYGAPGGYYLGGNFNGVNLWDPREAAHFTNVTESGSISLDYGDFGDSGEAYNAPTKIDITLVIDLHTAGDRFKVYRLGTDGKRTGVPTIYIIPRKIISNVDLGTGSKTLYDNELNTIVPTPGKYELRFKGNVKYKGVGDANTTERYGYNRAYSVTGTGEEFLTKGEYDTYNSSTDKAQITDALGNSGDQYICVGNWNGFVDELYVRKIGDSDTVTVNFDLNEGTLDGVTELTETVAWGGKLDENEIIGKTPTKEGFTFDGWFDAKEGGTQYTSNTVITSSGPITLYAHWKAEAAKEWKVTFDSDGGSAVAAATVQDGNKVTKPANPTKAGYDFVHWYLSTDATKSEFNFNTTITGDIKLVALWKAKEWTVTFDSDGGNTTPADQTVTNGGKVAAVTAPTRLGWTFGGWKAEGATANWNFTTNTVTANVKLVAQWTADYYMITGTTQTLLNKNLNATAGTTEYMLLGANLSASTTLSFRHGDTVYSLTRNITASGIGAVSGTTVTTISAGYYDIYLKIDSNSSATLYTEYAKNTTGTYTVNVSGKWGYENWTWKDKVAVKRANVGNTITVAFYIDQYCEFGIKITNSSGTQTGWYGPDNATYTEGTHKIKKVNGNLQAQANGIYTFEIVIKSGGGNSTAKTDLVFKSFTACTLAK